MFQFPQFPLPALCVQTGVTPLTGCWVSPFRNPRIKAYSTAPRGISQPITSFIGRRCQGIHRWPLVACVQTYVYKMLKKSKYDPATSQQTPKGIHQPITASIKILVLAMQFSRNNTTTNQTTTNTNKGTNNNPTSNQKKQRHPTQTRTTPNPNGSKAKPEKIGATSSLKAEETKNDNQRVSTSCSNPRPEQTSDIGCLNSLERR